MPDPHHNPLGAYRTVDAYGAAAAGDRVALISRLLQGAVDRIVTARGHLVRQETAAKGEQLRRAIGMIEGLRVAIDHQRGGEIAANLERLYEYMVRRLTEGNLRNDADALDEVAGLLGGIRSAWDEAARSPAARGTGIATAPSAPAQPA
jgi:flagellar protein FliS